MADSKQRQKDTDRKRTAMIQATGNGLNSKIPSGSVEEKWDRHRFDLKLVNPANKRKYTIIVVGTGLAGASAAASLAELGYNVLSFCLQDSPRRAHSVAFPDRDNVASLTAMRLSPGTARFQ